MKALIDMDIVVFRAAASCERRVAEKKEGNTEPDEDYVAFGRLNQIMEKILSNCNTSEYEAWLSSKTNFRYSIFPEYKKSRKDKPKPTHFQACVDYAQHKWGSRFAPSGYEADDIIVVNHVPGETIICSNDKDFRSNATGHHYNFTLKDEAHVGVEYIDEEQRRINFLHQMLMGDKADDIVGPYGHSAHATVRRFLDENQDLSPKEQIKLAYSEKWGDEGPKWERMNYRLLRMLQSHEELNVIKEEKRKGYYPNFGEEEADISSIPESKGKRATKDSTGRNPDEVSIRFGAR